MLYKSTGLFCLSEDELNALNTLNRLEKPFQTVEISEGVDGWAHIGIVTKSAPIERYQYNPDTSAFEVFVDEKGKEKGA